MLRLPLTALSIVCLILLSCWSIWRTTVVPLYTPAAVTPALVTPIATVTAAPAVVARPQPTATTPPLIVITGVASLPPFQLLLPPDWQAVHLPNDRAQAQLQAVVQTQLRAARFNDGRPGAMDFVLAWPTTASQSSGLIAYRAPRHELTLAQYVADSAAGLRAQPGVTLHQATVDYTLHAEVPVALLHYTLSAGQSAGQEGYQVLLFDEAATHLLLLTFIAPVSAGHTALMATTADQPPVPAIIQAIVHAVKR